MTNRDAAHPEVLAAAAQTFFETDLRLTEAVRTGTPVTACLAEAAAALKALTSVMLDEGVIASCEPVLEAYPDPNGCGLIQVSVESPSWGVYCLLISPQTGEVSLVG